MSILQAQKIVVPVDFSDLAFEALDRALEIAEGNAQRVYVIHVLADLMVNEPGAIWGEINNEKRTRNAKEALRQRLSDDRFRGLNIEIEFGDAGHRIAEYAKKLGAELIVMPSHGRTGLSRVLIGSVAQRVVQLAHCPVLVLRS